MNVIRDHINYISLAIALLLLSFTGRQYLITQDLLENGIQTTAEVIEVKRKKAKTKGDSDTFRPVYQYRNRANTLVTYTEKVGMSPCPYKKGIS